MTPYAIFQEYVRLGGELGNSKNISNITMGENPIQADIYAMGKMSEILSKALEEVSNYMVESHETNSLYIQIIFYAGFCVIPIILLTTTLILVKCINKEKQSIFKCLAALPKNTVSSIAERLKVLKKDNSCSEIASNADGEINKQEDNLIKILATADSRGFSMFNSAGSSIIGSVVQSICVIIAFVLLSDLFISQSEALYQSAPHIDNLMGTFAYQMGVYVDLQIIAAYGSECEIPDVDLTNIREKLETYADSSVGCLNTLRYGDSATGVVPFEQFAKKMEELVKTSTCHDVKTPSNLHEIYECFEPEVAYMLYDALAATLYFPFFQLRLTTAFDYNNNMFMNMWHIENVHLYNNFYAPLFSSIVPDVVKDLFDNLPRIFGISAILIGIAVITEIVVFYFIQETEKRLKYALRLLLHCPPTIILQNTKIMNLLSGNFRQKTKDGTNRDQKYYDLIAENMPDAIIVVTEEHMMYKINFINKSAQRIFNKTEEIIEHTIQELVDTKTNPNFIANLKISDGRTIDDIEFITSDGGLKHFSVTYANLKNEIIISLKDTTDMIRYNNLIAEEHAKSDMLLASILPANLAKRVQQGETDICFSVQSVTISFIDIVEFTPWCGSLEASEVMLTLNNLFTRFDIIVNSKPTMTKIKCIGDCYMSAGGIFMEVNQPALHAKEVVEFGLEAIEAIESLNKEINQNLRIRVGVNTGGPIVSGVLGIGKPTFEILGPAINMAQQMEHCGVPMQVHISRYVYELIYGDTFQIKERGEISIKNGKVVTYLVSKKKQNNKA
ncbi:Adenylate and Guanylate cyclase catalytic domain containing protein [Tritrichomonas foetus]|uniref:Adenylate and Guanylate cyclase catalytic domain containing protein n=1 Tax=Tritrichomonas foetus TaxID=1144522 RepID=A0A1J4K8D6_9EUKA|nr:Adenylate and Guanylate cyclase catalytic domain containing protein [Tritrichomonas foetus]|eukprot:OHT07234.1 Adenylate and Guanylate cyclase catalytic domain containing protein [Tritrichomonas foetus]